MPETIGNSTAAGVLPGISACVLSGAPYIQEVTPEVQRKNVTQRARKAAIRGMPGVAYSTGFAKSDSADLPVATSGCQAGGAVAGTNSEDRRDIFGPPPEQRSRTFAFAALPAQSAT